MVAIRLNNEGVTLEKNGDLKAAVETYRRALELDPAHNGIRVNLAVALLRTGDWREGLDLMREAVRRDPNNPTLKAALDDALKQARDPEVRAVVLTGAGRGFCVGQDLAEFRDLRMDTETFAVAAGAQRELAARGRHRIALPDLLIAACAQQHSAAVLHVDRHYDALAEVLAFRPVRAG